MAHKDIYGKHYCGMVHAGRRPTVITPIALALIIADWAAIIHLCK